MTSRILIAEDDYFIAADMAEFAESSFGCEAIVVSSCKDAWSNLSPDMSFAFLDLELADGSSKGFARALKDMKIPYAFVSGRPRSELPEDLQDAPFIAKPARSRTLYDTVVNCRNGQTHLAK